MGELSEKDFDRIERFILGKLSEEEQSRFQKEIDSNPDLKKRLERAMALLGRFPLESESSRSALSTAKHEALANYPKSPFSEALQRGSGRLELLLIAAVVMKLSRSAG